jgi:hypothetical protein
VTLAQQLRAAVSAPTLAAPLPPSFLLQFRPSLEELRSNYYREMRKFIALPSQFSGFGNAHVFAPMADRNSASLTQVYRKVRGRVCTT